MCNEYKHPSKIMFQRGMSYYVYGYTSKANMHRPLMHESCWYQDLLAQLQRKTLVTPIRVCEHQPSQL